MIPFRTASLFFVAIFAVASLNCGGSPASQVIHQTSSASSPAAPATTTTTAAPTQSSSSSSGVNATKVQGTLLTNLQQKAGWTGYGLLAPSYNICSSCKSGGPKVAWSMSQKISSPSLDGDSSKFDLGGQTIYSDALWNNHLVGDFSSQGMEDKDHKIVPAAHNFVYDVYFYASDISQSQAVEFDINQFVNGQSFIWGHECRIAGGNEWDIWDNPGQRWHPTGIPCNPKNNAWNHLVLEAQRTSDNHLLFQSITLNGQKSTLNYYESPTSTNWYGITINYQQDGNYKQAPYSIWLDKLNFNYW